MPLAPFAYRTLSLPQSGRPVLGTDLNCSESAWGTANPVRFTQATGEAAALQDFEWAYVTVTSPPEYDHPFQGTTQIIYATDQAALKAACRLEKLNPGITALGCRHVVGMPPQVCVILLPPQKDIEATGIPVAQVIRHEEAHCNGWPVNHPGGIKTYATGHYSCEQRYTPGCID